MMNYLKKTVYLPIFFFSLFIQAQKSFYLLGDANKMPNDVYELTPDKTDKVGLMISLFPIDLNQPFSKTFELYFGDKDYGADGIAFSFLDACSVKATVGADLGMSGITESLFVEFDTFQNIHLGDRQQDHMAIMSRGSTDHYSANAITKPIEMDNIENQKYHLVNIKWTPNSNGTQTFEVEFIHSNGKTYKRLATRNFIKDIFGGNSIVFWGLSASTGDSTNSQRVRIQEYKAEKYSCKGNTITLEAPQKGTNYSWTSDTSTVILGDKNYLSISPSKTTEYTCNYTDYCGTPNQTVKYKVYVAEFSENHIDPTCKQKGSITLSVKDGKAPYTYTLDGISKKNSIETYTFNNLSAGSHSYTIKTSTGCSESGSITLQKSPLPLPPDVPNQSYCIGDTRPVLEVNNPDITNYTYTWYQGSTKINEGVRLDYSQLSDPSITSGSFTVTATDKATGCISKATTVTLKQNPLPPSPSADSQQYCAGDTRPVLEVKNPDTTNYTYTWYESGKKVNQGVRLDYSKLSDPSIISGSFTVTATDKTTGCISKATTVTLKQNPLPAAPSVDSKHYCAGDTRPVLEVKNADTTNYTYTWYESGKKVNQGVRLDYSQLSDPSITSGSFTVTATDKATGCVSKATTVTLSQNPKPTITLEVNPTCSADLKTYIFTVSSESGNDISTDDNQASIQDNANGTWTIRVPIATAKNTISVTARNKEGCNITQTFNKPDCSCPVIPAPTSSDEAYCAGDTRPVLEVKNADTKYTYTWYQGSRKINEGVRLDYSRLSDPSITSGSFTVTATDKATGCVSKPTTVTLKQNPLPATPSADSQQYCIGDTRPVLEVNNPNTKYTYTWYQGSRKINEGVRLDYSQLSDPSMPSGSFTVTATDKATGCVSKATTVDLIENPKPNVSPSANHHILFYGQPLELYSNASSAVPYTLSWKGPNGFRSQQENPVIRSVQAKHSGTYQVTLINDVDCSAVSQVSLQVYIDVETVLGEDVVSCSDGTSFTFSYPHERGLAYKWSGPNGFSSTENRITVTEVGVYTLTVRASDGNESVGSVRIKASDLRVEKVNTCLAQTIVNPSGGRLPYEYSLDGVSFQSSPIFKGDFSRAHTVYVRDGNGCEVTEQAKGFKFDLYGVFSPNGDGINDRWDLSALSGCDKVRVKLFDRYGRYVHQMRLENLSWDGRVKGKSLPSGTYWYVIEFNDGVTPVLKGNLTIKRRKD